MMLWNTSSRLRGALARGLVPALLAAAALAPAAARAGPDVGVSVQISQPGVYGRVDIGRFPAPIVVSPRPVVVYPAPRRVVVHEPVYMWVPPGHRKHWGKHCKRYGACAVPVVFVDDRWYDERVMKRPWHEYGREHRRDHRRDEWREHRRDDRWHERRRDRD